MVEENQYRQTYRDVNSLPCPYGRAILTRCCNCEKSERLLIAGRESVGCNNPVIHQHCTSLLEHIRNKALFAIKMTQLDGPLPFAKEMKIQCGGLRGLADILQSEENKIVKNVAGLVLTVVDRYPSLDELPYEQIIVAINKYQHRRQRGSNIP